MRHQNLRRTATNAGYPPPPPIIFAVLGSEEAGYTLDDETWFAALLPTELKHTTWNDFAFGPKGYLVVGGSNFMAFSKDGKNWESILAPVSGQTWMGAAYSPSLDIYLIMSADGTNYRTSDPEAGWTAGSKLAGGMVVNKLIWDGGKFIATSSIGTGRLQYSATGVGAWTRPNDTATYSAVCWGVAKLDTGRFIVGGVNRFNHTMNDTMLTYTNVAVSSIGRAENIIDTPLRFVMYESGSTSIFRYLKSNPASGVTYNLGVNRNLVRGGIYRAENNRMNILLNWAAVPTRHLRFDPSPTGSTVVQELIDRGVGANATILIAPQYLN